MNEPDASISWRRVTAWLITAVCFLGGSLVAWHLRDFDALSESQKAVAAEGRRNQEEIVKLSAELVRLRIESQEWRKRADEKFDALLVAQYGLRPLPGFSRDKQNRVGEQ